VPEHAEVANDTTGSDVVETLPAASSAATANV
jgi:hypothetical protein